MESRFDDKLYFRRNLGLGITQSRYKPRDTSVGGENKEI